MKTPKLPFPTIDLNPPSLAIIVLLTLFAHAGLRAAPADHSAIEIRRIADKVSAVELPAEAVTILESTPAKDRNRVATRIIRIFLQGRPSLGPSLIASIVKADPQLAIPVTTEAIRLFPEHSYQLVKAAILSAPELAPQIALQLAVIESDHAQPILAAAVSAKPTIAPMLLEALENTTELQRTESVSALRFTVRRFRATGRGRGGARGHDDDDDDDDDRGNGHGRDDNDDDDDDGNGNGNPDFPVIDFGQLPFQDLLEIRQRPNGVWVIEITVPKGRVGNQIVRTLRNTLRELLAHPRLRHLYKIEVNRYNH